MYLYVCVSFMVLINIELLIIVMLDYVFFVYRSCNEVDSNRLRLYIFRIFDFCWCDSYVKE